MPCQGGGGECVPVVATHPCVNFVTKTGNETVWKFKRALLQKEEPCRAQTLGSFILFS